MSSEVETTTANGTYTNADHATVNYYAAAKTWAYARGLDKFYFFRVNLPANLVGREVLSATLRVVLPPPGGSKTTKLQRHADPATGYALMHDTNKPGVLAGSTEHAITSSAQFRDFDVLDDLQDIAAGGDYFGWRFWTTATTDLKIHGWGSEYKPTLTVVLADESSDPTNVRPHGIVSIAKPFVTWDGPDGIVSVQVQVDDVDGDFVTPIFDSGTVSSDVPQLDLATTAYAGLADAASVDIRVRHTTTDNGVSAWSDPVTITRNASPAVAFTSPGSSTTDPTPPAAWTAAVQTRYQVTTYVNDVVVADTGVVPGTDNAYTPPKGATASGQTIRYRLRVWFNDDQVSSPGDPGYVEVSTETTYTPGTAAAITTITAEQDGVRPWVDLAWTRSAGLADEWIVERDIDNGEGFVILDRFDGTQDGDPVWTYRDWKAPGFRTVTYRVRPVVTGAAGAVGPTASVVAVVTGAWIFDPVSGRSVRFGGQEPDVAYVEQSVWFEPIGSPTAVKRTFSLRGLEGTIRGTLKPYDGRSVESLEADVMWFKGHGTDTYRVAFGDVNIPAVLDVISPTWHAELANSRQKRKVLSVGLRQDGELPFPVIAP